MISTKTHGVLDYLVGILLIAAPFILGFAGNNTATMVPVILGAMTIVYSLITRYELSLINIIPFKVHLGIDFLSGLLLAASPWLFGFHEEVYLPHLVVGIIEIIVVALSKKPTDLNRR